MRLLPLLLFLSGSMACPDDTLSTCYSLLDSRSDPHSLLMNTTSLPQLQAACRSFTAALPCFDARLSVCGKLPQRAALEKARRLHVYMCAAFSQQRQRLFVSQSDCLRAQLLLRETDCEKEGVLGKKLAACRMSCRRSDRVCERKVETSETAICTLRRIEKNCGIEAAQLYKQVQQILSEPEYPIQCAYSLKGIAYKSYRKGIPPEPLHPKAYSTYVSVVREKEDKRVEKSRSLSYSSNVFASRTADKPTSPTTPLPTPLPTTPLQTTTKATTASTTTKTTTSATKTTTSTTTTPTTTTSRPTTTTTTTTRFPSTTPFRKKQFESNPYAKKKEEKWLPWYFESLRDDPRTTTTPDPRFVYRPAVLTTTAPSTHSAPTPSSSSPRSFFTFKFNEAATTEAPLSIAINWMHEGEWVEVEKEEEQGRSREEKEQLDIVRPLVQHLPETINITQLSHQANHYLNAALHSLGEDVQEVQRAMHTNEMEDTWNKLIQVVAPAVQKVSPEMIDRLKVELDKFRER